MSNSNPLFIAEKNRQSAILEIFFIESTSEFQTSVTFFISEWKHKVWVVILIVRS